MKILFRDIPKNLPFKLMGHDAVKTGAKTAKANLFGASNLAYSKWESVFVRPKRICEMEDAVADMNNLGRFGIPPRPDTKPCAVVVKSYKRKKQAKELVARALTRRGNPQREDGLDSED